MSDEKWEETNNISMDEYVKELHKKKTEILNDFAKAYLAETELLPSEIELVCRQINNGTTIENIYEFRRKDESRG